MARYRSRRRSRDSRPLVAFLLVASLGILFVGCAGPQTTEEDFEEFTFTEDDIERFRKLAREAEGEEAYRSSGALAVPHLLKEGGEDAGPPVLDLSLKGTYDAIRSEPGGLGESLYRVTNAFLNVRSQPRVTASEVDRLNRGDTVEVLEFADAAWAKVKLADGTEGYVAQRYIAKLTSEERLALEKEKFEGLYFVDFGFLNVRKEPDAQSEKLGELGGQAFVRPLSMDEVWARITFEGKEGYVAVQYLSPFLPNFLVRQDTFTLPILHYRLVQEGALDALTKHVGRLKEEGVTFITLSEFYNLLFKQEEKDVRLDPKTVVLVLSDITPDNVRELSDVLRASGVSATLFLQTQYIGLEGITEKKILTLMANGHDLQSGGHTGDDMRSLTNAQVELELGQSRKILEDITKKTVSIIGYAQGGVNDRVASKAADAGYLLGVGAGSERTFSREQFLRIPGFRISPGMTADEVVAIAKGE